MSNLIERNVFCFGKKNDEIVPKRLMLKRLDGDFWYCKNDEGNYIVAYCSSIMNFEINTVSKHPSLMSLRRARQYVNNIGNVLMSLKNPKKLHVEIMRKFGYNCEIIENKRLANIKQEAIERDAQKELKKLAKIKRNIKKLKSGEFLKFPEFSDILKYKKIKVSNRFTGYLLAHKECSLSRTEILSKSISKSKIKTEREDRIFALIEQVLSD